MQRMLVCLALFAATQLLSAQEQLPRKEALKIAFYLASDLKRLEGTPIPTDVDLKNPIAVRDGEYGGLLLPECKLAQSLAKLSETVVPVGQLWLHKLTPVKDGEPVPASKLQVFTIDTEQEQATGIRCALGIQKNGSDAANLLIYGRDKEPLLKVPLTKVEARQQAPLEISADRTDDGAQVTLKIAGRYQGSFKITAFPE